MLSEKSQQIVLERDGGDTLVEIAERHGVSHQRVAAIVGNAEQLALTMMLDLRATRQDNDAIDQAAAHDDHDMLDMLGERQQCAYVIPYGLDYTAAVAFSDWLCGRLRAHGLVLEIETRRASNGLALLLTDVTDYRGGNR